MKKYMLIKHGRILIKLTINAFLIAILAFANVSIAKNDKDTTDEINNLTAKQVSEYEGSQQVLDELNRVAENEENEVQLTPPAEALTSLSSGIPQDELQLEEDNIHQIEAETDLLTNEPGLLRSEEEIDYSLFVESEGKKDSKKLELMYEKLK